MDRPKPTPSIVASVAVLILAGLLLFLGVIAPLAYLAALAADSGGRWAIMGLNQDAGLGDKIGVTMILLAMSAATARMGLGLVRSALADVNALWVMGVALTAAGVASFYTALLVRTGANEWATVDPVVADWVVSILESIGGAFVLGSITDISYALANGTPWARSAGRAA